MVLPQENTLISFKALFIDGPPVTDFWQLLCYLCFFSFTVIIFISVKTIVDGWRRP